MAWEIVEKQRGFFKNIDVPAVAITSKGFRFSKRFCDAFGFKKKSVVLILYDPGPCLLGFKIAGSPAELSHGYILSSDHSKYTLDIHAPRTLTKIGIDLIGYIYEAKMMEGDIVKIELCNPLEIEDGKSRKREDDN